MNQITCYKGQNVYLLSNGQYAVTGEVSSSYGPKRAFNERRETGRTLKHCVHYSLEAALADVAHRIYPRDAAKRNGMLQGLLNVFTNACF